MKPIKATFDNAATNAATDEKEVTNMAFPLSTSCRSVSHNRVSRTIGN